MPTDLGSFGDLQKGFDDKKIWGTDIESGSRYWNLSLGMLIGIAKIMTMILKGRSILHVCLANLAKDSHEHWHESRIDDQQISLDDAPFLSGILKPIQVVI